MKTSVTTVILLTLGICLFCVSLFMNLSYSAMIADQENAVDMAAYNFFGSWSIFMQTGAILVATSAVTHGLEKILVALKSES